MNNRLYVGNLSFHTTEDVLLRAFGAAGEVTEAKLVIDRETAARRAASRSCTMGRRIADAQESHFPRAGRY